MQEQYICKTFISVKIPPLSYECNHSIVMLSYCRHMFIRTAFSFNSLRKQEANRTIRRKTIKRAVKPKTGNQ